MSLDDRDDTMFWKLVAADRERIIKDYVDRIEQLEAALRLFVDDRNWPSVDGKRLDASEIARAALDNLCEDEGCPNAGTPHVCINRVRQENDDVYPGFRGNNEA